MGISTPPRRIILDVGIHDVRMTDALALIRRFLAADQLHHIVTVGPEFLMHARRNTRFRDVLNRAALSVPDGFGVLCAGWYLRQPLHHRVTGADLTLRIAELCAQMGKRMYLAGGEGEETARAAATLRRQYPALQIAGASLLPVYRLREGALDVRDAQVEAATQRVLADIRRQRTDVLLVAMTPPKQDLWIDQYRGAMAGTCVAMGVGGTFAFLAGMVPRAPLIFRLLGMEWLWRVLLQPRRIRRILTAVIRFPLTVVFRRS